MKSKHEQKFFKKDDAKEDNDLGLSEAFKRVQVKPQVNVELPCTATHDMFLMTPKACDRRNKR